MGFRLVPNLVKTLNGVISVILRYYTEFGRFGDSKVKVVKIDPYCLRKIHCVSKSSLSLQRVRIARYAERCNSQRNSVCPSVRSSVCPSRSGIVFIGMKKRSCGASGRTITLVSKEVKFIRIFQGISPSVGVKLRHPSIDSENMTNNRP